jgi:hypothetical protein
MSNLDLIAITPSLAIEIKQNEIKAKIVERLTELKLIDGKYKMNNDILLLICNLVEHLVKDKKIKKKDLVLDVLQQIFNISAAERLQIDANIEFLHSNKAIKKLSKFYLFCVSSYEYFFKSSKKKG